MDYALKTERVQLGQQALDITSLRDLNETIDQLFAALERDGDSSRLEELCPYFGCVWPSARALCNYLQFETIARLCENRTILELGCGLALPSLVAARLGGRVTASDFHPDVPVFLEKNRTQNRIEPSHLRYQSLDWRSGAPLKGSFDWILGSDVLYEEAHAAILAQAIDRHLAPHGRALIADPGRPYLQAFHDHMQRRGFQSTLTAQRIADSPHPKEIFVLDFSRDFPAKPDPKDQLEPT